MCNLSAAVSYTAFEDWEDFLILSRDIRPDDLIVFTSSRKGSVSHQGILENIPNKLEKHFEQNSKVVIYPQQYGQFTADKVYEDISSGPIAKSIHTIERGIGSIFRREKKD